jgi:transposase
VSLHKKGAVPHRIGRTNGGLTFKLHAVCDGDGKPLILLLTEGGGSAIIAAARPSCPRCQTPGLWSPTRASRRDWFRHALSKLDITPCIPRRKNCKAPPPYDAKIYQQRNLVERKFGRLKDWRWIATRFERCAHTFMSAICIAATVLFWL